MPGELRLAHAGRTLEHQELLAPLERRAGGLEPRRDSREMAEGSVPQADALGVLQQPLLQGHLLPAPAQPLEVAQAADEAFARAHELRAGVLEGHLLGGEHREDPIRVHREPFEGGVRARREEHAHLGRQAVVHAGVPGRRPVAQRARGRALEGRPPAEGRGLRGAQKELGRRLEEKVKVDAHLARGLPGVRAQLHRDRPLADVVSVGELGRQRPAVRPQARHDLALPEDLQDLRHARGGRLVGQLPPAALVRQEHLAPIEPPPRQAAPVAQHRPARQRGPARRRPVGHHLRCFRGAQEHPTDGPLLLPRRGRPCGATCNQRLAHGPLPGGRSQERELRHEPLLEALPEKDVPLALRHGQPSVLHPIGPHQHPGRVAGRRPLTRRQDRSRGRFISGEAGSGGRRLRAQTLATGLHRPSVAAGGSCDRERGRRRRSCRGRLRPELGLPRWPRWCAAAAAPHRRRGAGADI
mmetsp:Transcript_121426/g.348911  ORF Transcript_121426/g.348911 Transcript_121426/m.348911 type:complete len:469 (-) Transcript_121426:230-1636(-)